MVVNILLEFRIHFALICQLDVLLQVNNSNDRRIDVVDLRHISMVRHPYLIRSFLRLRTVIRLRCVQVVSCAYWINTRALGEELTQPRNVHVDSGVFPLHSY